MSVCSNIVTSYAVKCHLTYIEIVGKWLGFALPSATAMLPFCSHIQFFSDNCKAFENLIVQTIQCLVNELPECTREGSQTIVCWKTRMS